MTGKPYRRTIRLAGYDYREAGGYFVTLCAARRRPVFGEIRDGVMHLNAYGQIVHEEWLNTACVRPEIELDAFVVMPDHFHAIIRIVGACGGTPRRSAPQTGLAESEAGVPPHAPTSPSRDLGALINGFKGAVTRRANLYRTERNLSPATIWQRNYFERIIRDEPELNATRRYIFENPLTWPKDPENL